MKGLGFFIAALLVVDCVSAQGLYEQLFNHFFQRNIRDLKDQQIRPRLMTQMKLDVHPRVIYTIPDGSSGVGLAVTYTNDSDGQVSLGRVSNVSDYLHSSGFVPTNLQMVGAEIGWPQHVGEVLDEYLSNASPPYWWTSTAYYGEEDGKIVLLPVNGQNIPIIITPEDGEMKDYVYWNIEWADMNNDGWADVIASRTQGKEENIKSSELIWLENPGTVMFGNRQGWMVHPITNGPDVNFRIMKVPLPDGGTRNVIIGLGYWTHKMYAIWTDDAKEDWSNVELIKERVIDNHDSFWDIQIADVNADGRDDIIVSTYTWHSWRSSLFVYELPCDFQRDNWKRHTLISGGDNMSDEPFNSGPQIKIFHPIVRDRSNFINKKKPFILLSGDNDGYLKVLSPQSRQSDSWTYSKHVVFKANGPVGPVALEDLDHDGYMEILVPVVDSQRILIFTYKPGDNMRAYDVDENRDNIDQVLELIHEEDSNRNRNNNNNNTNN